MKSSSSSSSIVMAVALALLYIAGMVLARHDDAVDP